MKVEISRFSSKTIKTDASGIVTFDEIISQLTPIAAGLFLLAMRKMIAEPDNEKRNAKYADCLTEDLEDCEFFPSGDAWKDCQFIVFEDCYNLDLQDALFELVGLSLSTSKRGRNGFVANSSLFTGIGRMKFTEDSYLHYLEFGHNCEIVSDNAIKNCLHENIERTREAKDGKNMD